MFFFLIFKNGFWHAQGRLVNAAILASQPTGEGAPHIIYGGECAGNCPIPVEGVTLSVCDPSRPVNATLDLTSEGRGYSVAGSELKVNFYDQYGDLLDWGVADAGASDAGDEFWAASAEGFGTGAYDTYYAVGIYAEGKLQEVDFPDVATNGKINYGFGISGDAGEIYENASVAVVAYSGVVSNEWDNGNYAELLELGDAIGTTAYLGSVGPWAQIYATVTKDSSSVVIVRTTETWGEFTVSGFSSMTIVISDNTTASANFSTGFTANSTGEWEFEDTDWSGDVSAGDVISVTYTFDSTDAGNTYCLSSLEGDSFTATYTVAEGDVDDLTGSGAAITLYGTVIS